MGLKIIILSEKSQTKKRVCIVFTQHSRICKVTHSDRKQISAFLMMGGFRGDERGRFQKDMRTFWR